MMMMMKINLIFLLLIISQFSPFILCTCPVTNEFNDLCMCGIKENGETYIYCARKSLKQIPQFRSNTIVYEELILSGNQIERIDANIFKGIRVRKLNLESNRISYIDPNAFIELINYLEELYIDVDTINQIPQSIFNLANLKILKLNGFNLNEFHLQNLQKLKKLEKFSLINCKIKTIYGFQTQTDSIQQLKLLSLQSNQIDTIDDSLFTYLFNLEILNLNDNNLTNLNFNLKNLTRLHTIDLSYNGITRLNTNLFDVKTNFNLQRLLLNNNELTRVNQKFFKNLLGLKELNLDFNKLTHLESNVFLFNKNLELLSLNNNLLTDISDQAFNGLKTSLQRLHLSRNKLKGLNDDLFIYTTSLQQLHLDRNSLTYLNRNTFFGLETTLVELNLHNNKIKSLNGSVKFLKNIQKLKLNNNQLDDFNFNFEFESCFNLTFLNMESNALRQLPDFQAQSMVYTNLYELDLGSNYICTLHGLDRLKTQLPNLKYFKLSNNRIKCDCNLIDLKIYLNYLNDALIGSNNPTTQYDLNNYQCQLPNHLMGVYLNKINEADLRCDDRTSQENFPNCTALIEQPLLSTQRSEPTAQSPIQQQNQTTTTVQEFIKDISIDLNLSLNLLNISWALNEQSNKYLDEEYVIKYYFINYSILSKRKNEQLFNTQKYILPMQRYFEIKNFNLTNSNSNSLAAIKINVCISVIRKSSQEKYCKNFLLNDTAPSQQAGVLVMPESTHSQSQQQKSWFSYLDLNQVYGIIGALFGILLAFFLAFLFYYIKMRRLNRYNDKQKSFYESTILNDQLLIGTHSGGTDSVGTSTTSGGSKCVKLDFLHGQPQLILTSSHINPNSLTLKSNYNQNMANTLSQQRKFYLQQLNDPTNSALMYHVYHEIPDNLLLQQQPAPPPPAYSNFNENFENNNNNFFLNRTNSFNSNTLSSYKPIFISSSNNSSS